MCIQTTNIVFARALQWNPKYVFPDKNKVRHTTHTIVSWPNPKQLLMMLYSSQACWIYHCNRACLSFWCKYQLIYTLPVVKYDVRVTKYIMHDAGMAGVWLISTQRWLEDNIAVTLLMFWWWPGSNNWSHCWGCQLPQHSVINQFI